MTGITKDVLDAPFCFRETPASLPADLRPLWRVSAFVLILSFSRANRASIRKLQITNWAIRTENGMRTLSSFLKGQVSSEEVLIRFDPAFLIALDLGIHEGLFENKGGNILELTKAGIQFAQLISSESDCFVKEKEFLKAIKPYFLEKHIAELLKTAFK